MAWMSAATIVLLVVAFFAGLPVGPVTLAGGLVLVAVRPQLWSSRIDLRLVLAALAVFGASGVLATSLDTAGRLGHVSPLGLAVLGGLLASVGTNLAATLTLVPAASTATLRSALLIGVNLGVGFTPVASLATVLWRDSLAARGVPTPWRRYFAVAVPLSLVFLASSVLL
jgi:Na+/H+ antiporter NhaD/arsenite permease-like protein